MLLFAATTEVIGIHYIFGAFLFGAIIPHENAAAMRHEILIRLEQISVLLLLPVFFLLSGLKVNIRGCRRENILPLLAILAVAIGGKYVGAYVGARLQQVPHWQASSLGLLMNTRGLTELIILNVGLEKGLLSPDAVHDDGDHGARDHGHDRAAAGAHLSPAPGRPRHRGGRAGRARRRGGRPDPGAESTRERTTQVPLEIAVTMLAGARPAEVVVADLQPQGRLLDLGSGLTGELAEMAAAMERQEVLVRRGEELGVPVRVIAHPSSRRRG